MSKAVILLADECCSAASPCDHQKRDRNSICDTCQIAGLLHRLGLIADIAEGSETVNSLPHIAKIARGC